jgi:hypothetical protein
MNIFVLDNDPRVAANHMCNKHVVKMIVESCQLMSTAHHVLDGQHITRTAKNGRKFGTYEHIRPGFKFLRCTMINHPCTIWTRSSKQAYYWLWEHTNELLKVYRSRYDKVHSYDDMVQYSLVHTPTKISDCSMPPFAQAMPDKYKHTDAATAYRAYYIGEKRRFAKWPDGKIPKWYLDGCAEYDILHPSQSNEKGLAVT